MEVQHQTAKLSARHSPSHTCHHTSRDGVLLKLGGGVIKTTANGAHTDGGDVLNDGGDELCGVLKSQSLALSTNVKKVIL